jgi:hypothetical protein
VTKISRSELPKTTDPIVSCVILAKSLTDPLDRISSEGVKSQPRGIRALNSIGRSDRSHLAGHIFFIEMAPSYKVLNFCYH